MRDGAGAGVDSAGRAAAAAAASESPRSVVRAAAGGRRATANLAARSAAVAAARGMAAAAARAPLPQVLGLPLRELIVAPKVDQSELPYRMLCRKYGASLCYTPMLHAKMFERDATYRTKKFQTCAEDRPLFVQFAGDDKANLLAAAKLVEDRCDAVDINLGCPQNIARRGHYGSFLLEEWELLRGIVSHLSANLRVPVTCKIRLLYPVERTIELARILEGAGCQLLTVHGRTKEQKGSRVGACDWDAIRRVKQALRIPVIANGGVGTHDDALRCLAATGCDGVMSSEALLESPHLVAGRPEWAALTPFQVARDYLDMLRRYPERESKMVKSHLFKFLYGPLSAHPEDFVYFCKRPAHAKEHAAFVAYLDEGLRRMEEAHARPGHCQSQLCAAHAPDKYRPWYDRYQRTNAALYQGGALARIKVDGEGEEEVEDEALGAAPDGEACAYSAPPQGQPQGQPQGGRDREEVLRKREEKKQRRKQTRESAIERKAVKLVRYAEESAAKLKRKQENAAKRNEALRQRTGSAERDDTGDAAQAAASS